MQEFYDELESKKDWRHDVTQNEVVVGENITEMESWLNWG